MKKYLARMSSGVALPVFTLLIFAFSVPAQNMFRKASDFDGDGKADFAITRHVGGLKYWWIWQTADGLRVTQWGLEFDLHAAGDYDGDGRADIAVFREPTGFPPLYAFYILESQTNTFTFKTFSTIANFGSRLAHQDYNGDGKTDAGVNIGEFGLTTQTSVKYSGINAGFTVPVPPGAVPLRIGDMDGGGSADLAHYSFNNNVVTITSIESAAAPRTLQFGLSNDRYQMADFDGDGKGDLTIWRSSTGDWWWLDSLTNTARVVHWGQSGDQPVPADYDGDGKTDPAIWRAGAQGYYWILGSQSGVGVFPWGMPGDAAVAF